MTQAKTHLTLEEYLALDAQAWERLGLPEGRCEYHDGVVVELSPESEFNDRIALNLRDYLLDRVSNDWLIRVHSCEVVVPKVRAKDPSTRFPDLVVLREEHLPLAQRRLAIPLEAAPPQMIAEVVSSGEPNQTRDYEHKRDQYAARGVPEYWLLEPQNRQVRVLELRSGQYEEVGVFRGSDRLLSRALPGLTFTASQMLDFVTSRLRQEIARAEAERQRAEQAEQQLAAERLRVEAERQRAEQERQRAEQERQRADRLAELLRQQGIDPDRLD